MQEVSGGDIQVVAKDITTGIEAAVRSYLGGLRASVINDVSLMQLALERGVGTAGQYGVAVGEWTAVIFNPRTASTGTTLGAAGAAGATEVLVSSVPVLVGGFIFQGDSTGAKGILLRDTAATGNSVAAVYLAPGLVAPNAGATFAQYQPNGWKTTTGLTICGEAAGVSGILLYRTYQT